jgi:hypothetical protein
MRAQEPLLRCPGQAPPRYRAGASERTCATPPPGGRKGAIAAAAMHDCRTGSDRRPAGLKAAKILVDPPPRAREETRPQRLGTWCFTDLSRLIETYRANS